MFLSSDNTYHDGCQSPLFSQTLMMSAYSNCSHTYRILNAAMALCMLSPIFTHKYRCSNTQIQTYHTCNKQSPLGIFTLAQPKWIMKKEIPCQTWHCKTVASPFEAVMASVTFSWSSYPLPRSGTKLQDRINSLPILLNKGWMNKHCHYWMKRNFYLACHYGRIAFCLWYYHLQRCFFIPLTAGFFISKWLCYSL